MNVGQDAASLHDLGRVVEPQMQRDMAELHHSGRLKPLAPVRPYVHRPRNQFGTVLKGMLVSGLVFGLPVLLIAAVLQGRATTGGSAIAQGGLVGVMWGLFVGVPAAVVPGIFVGLYLQRREIVKRLRAQRQQVLVGLAEVREDLRCRLEQGLVTPQQAAEELHELWPAASPTYQAAPALSLSPAPPLPLPLAGRRLQALEIMILASAVADWSGGYVNVDHGDDSTPATVLRILQDPFAPERGQVVTLRHNELEAMDALSWTAQAPADDAYRQRVRGVLTQPEVDPSDQAAVTLVASAVGGLRRARSYGLA